MDIDRRILIFDGPGGELQQLALDLIGREFEVHYANDIDEAQMLVHETQGRINAVVFSARAHSDHVKDMARRFAIQAAALIPTGPRPEAEVVRALVESGVRWHLWDDPPDESIRFVISSVLFEQDPLEIRYHRRVPISAAVQILQGDRKIDASMRDVSLGGACLLGGQIGAQGDEAILRFCGESEEIEIPIRVAWSVDGAADAVSVAGIAFTEVSSEASAVIDRLMDEVVARHRIEVPS